MKEIIKELLKVDSEKMSNVYLNEIALLMEEIDILKEKIKSRDKIIKSWIKDKEL